MDLDSSKPTCQASIRIGAEKIGTHAQADTHTYIHTHTPGEQPGQCALRGGTGVPSLPVTAPAQRGLAQSSVWVSERRHTHSCMQRDTGKQEHRQEWRWSDTEHTGTVETCGTKTGEPGHVSGTRISPRHTHARAHHWTPYPRTCAPLDSSRNVTLAQIWSTIPLIATKPIVHRRYPHAHDGYPRTSSSGPLCVPHSLGSVQIGRAHV